MLLFDAEKVPHTPSEHLQEACDEEQNRGVDFGSDERTNGESPGAPQDEVGEDGCIASIDTEVVDVRTLVAQSVPEQAIAGALLQESPVVFLRKPHSTKSQ